jgi:hypothetical protein
MRALTRGIVLLAISGIFALSGCGEYKVIQRFPLANGLSVDILQEREWEYAPKLFYTVRAHGSVRVPATFFDAVGDERLQMIDSGKGVVGFVPTSAPASVWILLDPAAGESWPRILENESAEAARMRGERMLEVLRVIVPGQKFVLKN